MSNRGDECPARQQHSAEEDQHEKDATRLEKREMTIPPSNGYYTYWGSSSSYCLVHFPHAGVDSTSALAFAALEGQGLPHLPYRASLLLSTPAQNRGAAPPKSSTKTTINTRCELKATAPLLRGELRSREQSNTRSTKSSLHRHAELRECSVSDRPTVTRSEAGSSAQAGLIGNITSTCARPRASSGSAILAARSMCAAEACLQLGKRTSGVSSRLGATPLQLHTMEALLRSTTGTRSWNWASFDLVRLPDVARSVEIRALRV